MADYVSGEEKCGVIRIVEETNGTVAHTCARAVRHDGEHKDRDGSHWLGKGPILWPSEKLCGVPYLLESSDSGKYHLADGHDGEHKNSTGRSYSTAMAAVPSAEHTPQTGGPGMRPCGNVGPFDGMTCARTVGHSGIHEHPRAGMKVVWSDVTEESVAKQLTGLQRKVKAQANQINKLEELRKAAATNQPEYQELVGRLEAEVRIVNAQASLTEREHQFRVRAEQKRDSDRERRAELITNLVNDIRHHFGEPPVAGSATWADLRAQVGRLTDRERQFRIRAQRELDDTCERLNMVNVKSSDRLRKLGAALGVDISGQTWDNLIQRVAELKKSAGSVWSMGQPSGRLGEQGVTFSLPYTATTPLASRVDELTKRVDALESPGQNCLNRYSATGPGRNLVCALQAGHAGSHVDRTGASW
jgi:hypothetical protein